MIGHAFATLFLALTTVQAADVPAAPPAEDAAPAVAAEQFSRPVVITLEGVVSPAMASFLDRKLEEARETKADLVIFHVDSPGGYLSSMQEMIDAVKEVTWAETAVWIDDKALSAAALFSLSCDTIIMAPDARIGDAGPIVLGDDALFRHASEKIRSDLVQQVRDLAVRHDRPPALLEAMVDKDAVVYNVTNEETGEQVYLTEKEFESLEDADQWQRGRPVFESREGYFLDVNGTRAVELGLAEGTATSLSQYLERRGVTAEPRVIAATWVDTAAHLLTTWPITVLLLIIGGIALMVELGAPGMGVGGLISILCFGLFFWSRFLGGTAGWLEVVILVCGLLFLAAEIFLIPGFGIAGVGGVVLIAASLFMASRHVVMPESPRDLQQLNEAALTLLAAGIGFAFALLILSRFLGDIPVLRSFTLSPPEILAASQPTLASGPGVEAAPWQRVEVGQHGQTDSPLRPSGKAWFGDSLVDVVTEGEFVDSGTPITVLRKQGMRVIVREVKT